MKFTLPTNYENNKWLNYLNTMEILNQAEIIFNYFILLNF